MVDRFGRRWDAVGMLCRVAVYPFKEEVVTTRLIGFHFLHLA